MATTTKEETYDIKAKEKAIASIGNEPTAEKEDPEEAKQKLLQKIKDAANGPEQAKRKIKALDSAVAALKKKRYLAQEQINKDTEALRWLQHEIDNVQQLRHKLCKGVKAKKQEVERLEKVISSIKTTISGIMSSTEKVTSGARGRVLRLQAKGARENLRSTRGYGCGRGTTFYQTTRRRRSSAASSSHGGHGGSGDLKSSTTGSTTTGIKKKGMRK